MNHSIDQRRHQGFRARIAEDSNVVEGVRSSALDLKAEGSFF